MRFQPPTAPPLTVEIDTGNVGRVCPQAFPVWFSDIEPIFLVDYLTGQPVW